MQNIKEVNAMKKLSILILFLFLSFTVAVFGSYFTASSVSTWYVTLKKPSFNPPGWIFGPVWTILYILIAISGWLIWLETSNKNVKIIMVCFFIQLFLNALWSPLFFGLKNPGLAFLEICFLWLSIAVYIFLSRNVSFKATLLFLPYWGWVTFASILNFFIWRMN